MYKVEKTSYGFRLTIKGDFKPEEMTQCQADLEFFRSELPDAFSGFVDARDMIAVTKDAKLSMLELQKAIQKMGCHRFALILKSPVVSAQAKQIAYESGIAKGERYINAANYDNWEQLGLDWVIDGLEPSDNICAPKKQPLAN